MNTVKTSAKMEDELEKEEEVKVVCASVRAVFSNDYLREKILEMAISDRDPQKRIDRKTLVNVRQVQTSWRDTVSRNLNLLKEPLYTVKLDEINSLNGAPFVEASGKELDRFTAFFTGRDETFSLKLGEEFFRLDNYDSLSTCLKPCSKGLVQLEFVIPENVGSFPSIFPNVCLPNLKSLKVSFENGDQSSNITMLLATLLVQCPNLKEFTMWSMSRPPGFGYVSLPPTLRKIKFEFPMRSEDLQILERNPLPSLSELKLTVAGLPLPEETLLNVLSGCKDTLKVLSITGREDDEEEGHHHHPLNVVKFPEMAKLEKIQLTQFVMGLEDKTKENLNKCLPKLKNLNLFMAPSFLAAATEALATWTEKGRLEAINSLTFVALSMRGEEDGDQQPREGFLPMAQVLGKILQGMPNVRCLTLTVDGKHPTDLVPLFEKMGQITRLMVMVGNSDHIENSSVWDALLTGIPLEKIMQGLHQNSSLKEIVQKDDNVPSFRLLKNLMSVAFSCPEGRKATCARKPLVSGLTLKYAFQPMPALKILVLHDRFKVSQEVGKQWEKSGRCRCICQK